MRFVVALALLFAVTPGMTEVVESVAHAVGHGDLPHHEEAEVIAGGEHGEGMGGDEHTCTPLFHACGCHAAMSAQTTKTSTQSHPAGDASPSVLPPLVSAVGRHGEPPPLRPPIV